MTLDDIEPKLELEQQCMPFKSSNSFHPSERGRFASGESITWPH